MTQLGALTFLGAQLAMGLGVLTQLNWYSYVHRHMGIAQADMTQESSLGHPPSRSW